MKVTLIGSGNMGSALATQISKAGHTLVITGRNTDKAKELARTTGAVFKDKAAADGAELLLSRPRPTRMRWWHCGLPAI